MNLDSADELNTKIAKHAKNVTFLREQSHVFERSD